MRYQVGLFCIALSGQILTVINLSGLLTNSNQITTHKNKEKVMSVDSVNSLVVTDPDYQDAINILYDQNDARIYDDYLQSISRGFMDYYLNNIQNVKIVEKKPKVINLSALKSLTVQGVTEQAKRSVGINLDSLINTVSVTQVSPKHTAVKLNLVTNADDAVVTTVNPSRTSHINLSSIQGTNNVEVAQPDSQPKKTKKKKKKQRKALNLSGLQDE